MPGLDLVARNVIPHGRGMGSSGAAIVAGVMAAKGLLEGIVDIDSAALLARATELEGHPDNVAPALFGGLTIAWMARGRPAAQAPHRAPRRLAARLRARRRARCRRRSRARLQPESVPHADAIFNVSRSALLIAALIQSPELLFASTEDKLHQNYRAAAMPETDALVQALRAKGYAAVVSGAGPSVLVLCGDPAERLAAAEVVAEASTTPWQAHMLAVDFKGATVVPNPVETVA